MERERKNLLVFGYGLALIMAFAFWRAWRHAHGLVWVHVVLGPSIVLMIFLSLFRHDWLRSFYKKWMILAHFIGNIISALILILLYYLIFAPAGIVLRLRKKDLLDRKLDKFCGSYWSIRKEKTFTREDYTRQF